MTETEVAIAAGAASAAASNAASNPNLWPAFRTQQKLQEQIRNVKLHVDAALLRLLGYTFYVLKCEPGDFSFDPQDWHPEIRDSELLLQENVYNACTNHSIDREAWQLGESGLPSNVFAYETDMSPDQRREAIELWLTLVREAADEPLLPNALLPDVPESLKSIDRQLQSERKCIESGSLDNTSGSLSSVGYLSGSSWIAMLPSKMEFAKFIMKVTLERPSDDLEPDVQVVEFWKRMGFEDIAEASSRL
eukprot:Skav236603  [mRNA]  locus=scaffold3534:122304:131336:- [translate_table: standard]